MVVINLYSTPRSASNALNVPLCYKKMGFLRRSEAVGTPSRVPEWVWKRVSFHRTRNGESPTTKHAATMSRNHQLVTVGRSNALAACDIRCMRAVVPSGTEEPYSADKVNCDSEFILDTLWNVQPM